MEPGSPAWGVRPWWVTVPCRDATASDQCVESTLLKTDCETVVDPATGEPVKHCVKIFKRYLKCAGRPEKLDEQKAEMTARGEGVEQLEPNLLPPDVMELPGRHAAAASGPAEQPGVQIEDVGHAVQEFLRFAEELQEQLVPGTMHLDQAPPAPARPYNEGQPQGEAEEQQQQQQQQQRAEEQPFGWLGGLLFGKRRAEGGGARKRHVDASMWREFERDFTEV